ncbi:MAG: pyridoxal phosphate-dependent aminotransferase [Tannerellaceae bacterium]|nr:pyridoxal phosphate-dependent aminotransferase [Tannerellaceae bacterium]
MKYNFDEIIVRRGTNSCKWDMSEDEGTLPMWVADMDFRAAPGIISALRECVDHGVFGYTKTPKEYFDATAGWFLRRHGFHIDREWILFTTGVVPALSAVIKALASPGDGVIVQTPVYNCFFSSIRNNQCEMIENRLLYRNGEYFIDFDDLERRAALPNAKLMLLCSPHNPAGRVWTRNELERIGEICLRNGLTVVSDEIHCDIVYPGYTHIPFAALGGAFLKNSVSCIAPTKTFNLAGVQVANIVAADEGIRRKIDKALNVNEVCEINAFAIRALIAAYNESEDWLEELKVYLYDNYALLTGFFRRHLPHMRVVRLEATYLVWIDCSALRRTSKSIAEALMDREKLWINEGSMYGEAGEGFIRINIATRRELLLRGLEKIKAVCTV